MEDADFVKYHDRIRKTYLLDVCDAYRIPAEYFQEVMITEYKLDIVWLGPVDQLYHHHLILENSTHDTLATFMQRIIMDGVVIVDKGFPKVAVPAHRILKVAVTHYKVRITGEWVEVETE